MGASSRAVTLAPQIHFHTAVVPSPAEARTAVRAVMPEMVRELRAQGLLTTG